MLKNSKITAIIRVVIVMRSVYIHIPFCSSICSYCDFCKFLHNEIWAEEYLKHLEKEIDENYDGDYPDVNLTNEDLEEIYPYASNINIKMKYLLK